LSEVSVKQRYLKRWLLNIGHSRSQCSNVWLPELQQGQVSGQVSQQVSLTILAALVTMLSNLYPQRSFNNQLNPYAKSGYSISSFEKSEECSSRFSE